MDRDRWIGIVKTVIVTALLAAVFVAIFAVALHYFEGWMQVVAIVGPIALLVFLAYLIRWAKYPGLFQAKTSVRLVGDYLGAVLLCSGGLVVILAIAQFRKVQWIHSLENFGYRVGLEFEYKKWSRAQVSSIAPPQFHPGSLGRIVGFRVIARDEVSPDPLLPVGTVLYRLRLPETEVDVPETYVVGNIP